MAWRNDCTKTGENQPNKTHRAILEEPTLKICQKQAPIKPSEDQKVEEDPLEEKIHRILDDLEEVFC